MLTFYTVDRDDDNESPGRIPGDEFLDGARLLGAPPSSRRGGLPHALQSTSMYELLVHVMETMAPPVFTVSTARQKFFSLFETVTGHRGRKVVITSRGSDNHAVLVREAEPKTAE